ncbi:hypothetical protein ACFQ44_11495 [Levilactobacillus lanxiensis]|uniref:Uncharacterized protein n=1 Tax=Levilactobacillus lanxiensis TaxID=2799568 RepID=A0ABW4D8J8_9LACO
MIDFVSDTVNDNWIASRKQFKAQIEDGLVAVSDQRRANLTSCVGGLDWVIFPV